MSANGVIKVLSINKPMSAGTFNFFLIKFKETRNYVQRVLENINVYKYILGGKPVRIHNFFEDKPHF